MSLKAKIILFIVLTGGVLGGITWGLLAFWDAAGDARENSVWLEWAEEKESLIQQRDAAQREAAENRKAAEAKKQENTESGENVIEQTRNIDADWSNTHLPSGMFRTLREN
jgi:hypothetical protein